MGNMFMDECINAVIFTISVCFKALLYRGKVEIRNQYTVILTGTQVMNPY